VGRDFERVLRLGRLLQVLDQLVQTVEAILQALQVLLLAHQRVAQLLLRTLEVRHLELDRVQPVGIRHRVVSIVPLPLRA
jgi:hypothetical protein